jgi:HK97 family phage portal protein
MGILDRIWHSIVDDPRDFRAQTLAGSEGMPGGKNVYFPTYSNNQPQYTSNPIQASSQGYQNSALIFRCVQYTSNAMGSAPLKLYQTIDDKSKSEEVNDHPFRILMRQPNLGQSEQTFLTFIGVLMCVTGFAVIEKERNLLGDIIGLWPLRSDWIRPIPRQGALPDWQYEVPGERPRLLKAEDAIPITYADTINNSPTGVGPLEAALKNMGIQWALTEFIQGFMDRGAMPMYVALPSDDPYTQVMWSDQAKVEAFREGFQQRFGGLKKSLDVAIPVGIKSIEPMGFNIDELAYPELFALNENAICQAFGISPIVVNTTSGLEQSSYNNYNSARRSFYEDTLTPIWGRVDDAFTRHLLYEMADTKVYSIAFDLSRVPALKDDVSARWTRATDAVSAGSITITQFLKEVELDAIQNGDVYLVPDGVSVIAAEDMKTGAIQHAEAEGDIESATAIAKVTQKAPHAETINRGVDSRSEPN